MKNMNLNHSWSRGQLEGIKHCPGCGASKENSVNFKRRDNDGYMPDTWSITKCVSCKTIWLNQRPDAQSLPQAYRNYYYTHNADSSDFSQDKSKSIVSKLINGYLNKRFGMDKKPDLFIGYIAFSLVEPLRLKLDYYGRHLSKRRFKTRGKLLDIGCGNGSFLPRAADMGWQTQGVEIDPKAVETCRSIGQEVLEGDAFHPELNEQSFDVITMSHVIEHIADQQALLRRTYELLNPGGWLWLALPNSNSIALSVCGTAWRGLAPPHHLCIPSHSVLVKWLKEQGFTDIQFMRRGSHGPNLWKDSQDIAKRESIVIPSPLRLFAWRVIADTLASFTPRWADDTVILARKPE